MELSRASLVSFLGSTIVVIGLSGCSSATPMAVSSYYGPGAKIDGLGPRYAWSPDAPEPRLGTTEARALVRGRVEEHLAAKGFSPVPAGEADFWVAYRVSRREKTDASVATHGEVVEEGALVLDALDPDTREWIWRGIAKARLQNSDPPELRTERLKTAVRRLMEQFPAKKPSSATRGV